MTLMYYNLDSRGLTQSFLTHNPRYSVSVHPKNEVSALTFSPVYAILCGTFYADFKWSAEKFVVFTGTFYIYVRTVSNPLKSSDIFSRKYQGYYKPPWIVFGTHTYPKGSQ